MQAIPPYDASAGCVLRGSLGWTMVTSEGFIQFRIKSLSRKGSRHRISGYHPTMRSRDSPAVTGELDLRPSASPRSP